MEFGAFARGDIAKKKDEAAGIEIVEVDAGFDVDNGAVFSAEARFDAAGAGASVLENEVESVVFVRIAFDVSDVEEQEFVARVAGHFAEGVVDFEEISGEIDDPESVEGSAENGFEAALALDEGGFGFLAAALDLEHFHGEGNVHGHFLEELAFGAVKEIFAGGASNEDAPETILKTDGNGYATEERTIIMTGGSQGVMVYVVDEAELFGIDGFERATTMVDGLAENDGGIVADFGDWCEITSGRIEATDPGGFELAGLQSDLADGLKQFVEGTAADDGLIDAAEGGEEAAHATDLGFGFIAEESDFDVGAEFAVVGGLQNVAIRLRGFALLECVFVGGGGEKNDRNLKTTADFRGGGDTVLFSGQVNIHQDKVRRKRFGEFNGLLAGGGGGGDGVTKTEQAGGEVGGDGGYLFGEQNFVVGGHVVESRETRVRED